MKSEPKNTDLTPSIRNNCLEKKKKVSADEKLEEEENYLAKGDEKAV